MHSMMLVDEECGELHVNTNKLQSTRNLVPKEGFSPPYYQTNADKEKKQVEGTPMRAARIVNGSQASTKTLEEEAQEVYEYITKYMKRNDLP